MPVSGSGIHSHLFPGNHRIIFKKQYSVQTIVLVLLRPFHDTFPLIWNKTKAWSYGHIHAGLCLPPHLLLWLFVPHRKLCASPCFFQFSQTRLSPWSWLCGNLFLPLSLTPSSSVSSEVSTRARILLNILTTSWICLIFPYYPYNLKLTGLSTYLQENAYSLRTETLSHLPLDRQSSGRSHHILDIQIHKTLSKEMRYPRAPGSLSWWSIQLLVSAQIMISELWDGTWHWAPSMDPD